MTRSGAHHPFTAAGPRRRAAGIRIQGLLVATTLFLAGAVASVEAFSLV